MVVLPVPVVAVALLLASLVAVAVVLPASVVAVGALLLLATPPALPVLTANLPDRWRSLPQSTRPNHPGQGYQQQNSPARVLNPILPTSQLPLAPPRFATTSLGEPSPNSTNYGRGGHGALSHTDVDPGGTTPICSLPPVASSRAT